MVPHALRHLRHCAGALATLVVAGCAAGDAGGAPFDANGTLDDLAAVTAAFDHPAVASFAALGDAMDAALGAPVTAPATRLIRTHDDAAFGASARELVLRAASFAQARPGDVRLYAVPSLPASALGDTYAWSPSRARYVRTPTSGTPADGVRFVLYALDARTGRPALPLRPVGHVDLLEAGNGAELATRVLVTSDETPVLDYAVAAVESRSGVEVTIRGTARTVRFTLTSAFDAALGAGRLDARLDAPDRGVSLDWALDLHDLAGTRPADLDVLMSGPHGNLVIGGTVRADGTGTLNVLANGVAFAVVGRSRAGSGAVHPDGTPLAPSEQGALLAMTAMANEGTGLFTRLLEPVDGLAR